MRSTKLYIIVSIPLWVLSYYLLPCLYPWIDEVMFLDTPSHFIRGDGWITYAWYAGGNQEPFSTYPPLYQWLSAGWMFLFGVSLLSCRSLNLLITFLIGLCSVKLIEKIQKRPLSIIAVIILALVIWCDYMMLWMSHNGRPDLLGALLCELAVLFAIEYYKNERSIWYFSVACFSILLSGFQATVFMALLLIILIILYRKNWNHIKYLCKAFVLSTIISFACLTLFMHINGHLFAFIVSIASYSSTLKHLAAALLPTFGPYLHLDVNEWLAKLADDATPEPLYIRLVSVFKNVGYTIMTLANICILISFRNKIRNINVYLTILFISLLIPLLMILAGRFVEYYHWMIILPATLLFTMLIPLNKKIAGSICALLGVVISLYGIYKMSSMNTQYKEQSKWIESLPISKNSRVVADFSFFYNLWPKTNHSYFLGVYPKTYVKDIDYVILKVENPDLHISEYISELKKDRSLSVELISSCNSPQMECYKVERGKQ